MLGNLIKGLVKGVKEIFVYCRKEVLGFSFCFGFLGLGFGVLCYVSVLLVVFY